MKKLTTLLLVLAMILPASSYAVTCVSEAYTLFIDADMYNKQYNAGFDFDSAIFDLIFMSDGKTVYYCRQMWKQGRHSSTDYIECVFSSGNDSFTITFPDGSSFNGYFDPDQNGVWLSLGGKSYFRFLPVARYNIDEDYKK